MHLIVNSDFFLLIYNFQQKELISTKEFEMQASMKQTLDALWSKNQDAALLEKQVEELKQRLHEAKTQNKEKVGLLHLFQANIKRIRKEYRY